MEACYQKSERRKKQRKPRETGTHTEIGREGGREEPGVTEYLGQRCFQNCDAKYIK